MKLEFYGGAGRVTGSNFLLESNGEKILIDCGLMQGGNFAEDVNFTPLPYNPEEVGAVFLTHAHIDHTGRLPKLAGEGFEGTVYSIDPTKDFSEYLLKDSINILTREANRCNADTFCNPENISKIMNMWETVDYHKPITFGPFTVTFYDAGHILGSSFIKVEAEGKTIVFSGDLGNSPAPLLKGRENLDVIDGEVDYCLIESTYGGRVHEPGEEAEHKLDKMIDYTVKKGGVLMIPAFAMERTQDIIFHIHRLMDEGKISEVPVFLDSPLAIKLTRVYEKYKEWLNPETKEFRGEGHKLFSFSNLTKTMSTEESKRINSSPSPKVIIAGSGMSNGGRILHHERRYLSDPNSAILMVGYQVEGSLGREILDGSKSDKSFKVKIFEEEVSVNCRVEAIGGYSAHADKPQLLEWIKPQKKNIKKAFVIHGEKDQSGAFAKTLEEDLNIDSRVPSHGDVVEL